MKVKKVYFIVLFLFSLVFNSNATGLDSLCKQYQLENQLGVNASKLIKNVFSFNNTASLDNSPYLFTYRLKTKWANPRFGIGIFKSNYEKESGAQATKEVYDENSRSFRIGIDRTVRVNKTINLYYGLDYFNQKKVSSFSTIFDGGSGGGAFETKSNVNNSYQGFSPVLSIEFNLNKNIAFFTEARINTYNFNENSEVYNSSFPSSGQKTTKKGHTTDITSPISIYLNIKF